MEKDFATKVIQTKKELYREYNERVLVIKKKRKFGILDTWINPEVIAKIL